MAPTLSVWVFDFRGKSIFIRFDGCEFVKCNLLIDHGTEQLAFTRCVFKDCNIDKLEHDDQRGLYARDNFFDRPLEERRAEFEKRLAQALAERAKSKWQGLAPLPHRHHPSRPSGLRGTYSLIGRRRS
jgi:hypothetical protein